MVKYVAFSGGKDSTALALLMSNAIPVFADTGAEFPELYAHIEKFERVTGREVIRLKPIHGTLLDYIKKSKFMPGHGARYCTRMFKIEPFAEYQSEYSVALRADEDRKGNDSILVNYPLQEMGIGINEVIKICIDNDLLPRSHLYMARGGCVNCFYKRKSEVWAMHHFIPDILDELQDIEEWVQDKRGKFAFMFPNTGMSIKNLRRQITMFEPEEIYKDAGNKSDYGTNCGLFCNR